MAKQSRETHATCVLFSSSSRTLSMTFEATDSSSWSLSSSPSLTSSLKPPRVTSKLPMGTNQFGTSSRSPARATGVWYMVSYDNSDVGHCYVRIRPDPDVPREDENTSPADSYRLSSPERVPERRERNKRRLKTAGAEPEFPSVPKNLRQRRERNKQY